MREVIPSCKGLRTLTILLLTQFCFPIEFTFLNFDGEPVLEIIWDFLKKNAKKNLITLQKSLSFSSNVLLASFQI